MNTPNHPQFIAQVIYEFGEAMRESSDTQVGIDNISFWQSPTCVSDLSPINHITAEEGSPPTMGQAATPWNPSKRLTRVNSPGGVGRMSRSPSVRQEIDLLKRQSHPRRHPVRWTSCESASPQSNAAAGRSRRPDESNFHHRKQHPIWE